MPGFGLSPFGSGMFGFGSIASTDPRGTDTITARTVDPETHDYVIDGRGLEATTPVKQRIVLAIGSTLGSGAAVPNIGLPVKPGTKMGKGFEARMKDAVRLSLRQLTDVEKKAIVTDILVSKRGNQALLTIAFRDLTDPRNKPEFVKIPVRL